jgi:hypothetical protein
MMSTDGRLTIRLGPLEPHLKELAKRDRRTTSDFIFDQLEKVVMRRVPVYRPSPKGKHREVA